VPRDERKGKERKVKATKRLADGRRREVFKYQIRYGACEPPQAGPLEVSSTGTMFDLLLGSLNTKH